MQVVETLTEGLRREFKITIPAAEVKRRVEGKLTEIGGQVRLPGFRPGKVPLQVLRQRYHQSVMGDVLNEAIQHESEKLLSEKQLRPAAQPKVEVLSFADDKDLEFQVAMEIIPEIAMMDFSSLKLVRDDVVIDEAEVTAVLERLASRSAKTEAAAAGHISTKGDILVIDFVGRVDGEEFPGGSAEDYHLELGSESFIPGFEDQLVGVKKGDAKTVAVTFPSDYAARSLAGKAAEFAVTVKDIQIKQAAKLDDDFAKSMGMETFDALQKSAREQVAKEYTQLARARLKRRLLDTLTENHDFTLPEGLVEAEFAAIWKQIEEDRKAGRLDPDDEGKDEKTLKTEYRAIAARRVKLGLLLSEVGRTNNIQLQQEDITRAMASQAAAYPGQERQVLDYYRNNPDAVRQLSAPLYEDKIVDFILDLAQTSERKISSADFKKEGEAA
ncbi:MAG TPA: trigger factor [Dongiaceae bacterium]|jgi:trigger factor|nr:trigger factor [Dongiaceae bacterium]